MTEDNNQLSRTNEEAASPKISTDMKTVSEVSPAQNLNEDLLRLIEKKLKKNWKEYLLEFLLVVAAVSLGFFADRTREWFEDRQKEKKYIRSFIKDMEEDANLSTRLSDKIYSQGMNLDTLQTLLETAPINDGMTNKTCYELTIRSFNFYPEFFYERTITQLLSSGNMRLIEDQDAADSIMAYHSIIKFLEVERQNYINAIIECTHDLNNIFDVSILKTTYNKNAVLNYVNFDNKNKEEVYLYNKSDVSQLKLLTTDPAALRKFSAKIESAKREANAYSIDVYKMLERISSLKVFLKKKYHLK